MESIKKKESPFLTLLSLDLKLNQPKKKLMSTLIISKPHKEKEKPPLPLDLESLFSTVLILEEKMNQLNLKT
jgi:hypothetical protein